MEYRSEMSNQTFVLTFENEVFFKKKMTSFSKNYVPRVEIKDFNVLINGKPFLKFL